MAGRRRGERGGRGGGRAELTATVDTGEARLVPDRERPSAWELTLDGAPQSHVDLAEPAHLAFGYQRRLGHLVDLLAPAGRPLKVLHLGGGALTLARYVAATRPRSTQRVWEVDAALTAFVRRELPLEPGWRVRVHGGDARAGLAGVPDGWADLVIADVFDRARTPPHLGTVEFVQEAARVLAPGGWYTANLTDGPPLAHLRGQLATVGAVFDELAIAADPAVLRGRRFGNVVLAAARVPLPVGEFTRRTAGDPHAGRVLAGREPADLAAGSRPVTDATATTGSPAPPPGTFER
ncbi:fused MFS/spermidine synthase [Streptomyces sp. P38-E01]|uniref:Fused MFS/spermidine synthase n=1 Tax=Streptomyces tardus TaxID=2780544 RepID=A0A949N8P5_9ACTN|nr:fused MFS/spermidine synthase [Streptomyces tardus]MBU7598776.1 fused MFS/spermidine synthase [Streptomyces tardus]